ncbi:MAG: competence/damage-inducible protein A, partial [Planctomycetia bacterium]
MMQAEIVSIGRELTWGQSLDTNAQWLSRRLTEHGIPVGYHTTVADDRAANVDVFRHALGRAKLVVATGGLGPTADDLTREVVAETAGVCLIEDPESLAAIQAMFSSRNRTMPERNRVQALFPVGATPIPNPNGTAPGLWMEVDGAVIVCMPGVPREMFAMFDDWVLPRVAARFGGGRAIRTLILRCFGAGEATVEEKLGDMIRRGRSPEVGITASEATISLRIVSSGDSPEAAEAAIPADVAYIYEKLGDLVYGEGDDELPEVVARMLTGRGITVSTAESCTGGLLGSKLTDVPGSSSFYLGGVVAYSNAVKERLLDVPRSLLDSVGAVSPEVAQVMAVGCRANFGSDYALSVTGVAGPGGGT